MISRKLLIAGCSLALFFVKAQVQESVMDTLYLFDSQIREVATFQNLTKLKSEDIRKNTTNLSDLLRFQSFIYIKENGRGATSSPAFRGTTAQQTAFVWNGININSAFLGQGDLNNIGMLTSDEITIKPGGGSVIYGSGAIGGSVHLNNDLSFNEGLHASLLSEAGSFGTFNNILKSSFSNDKFSLKFAGSSSISENNYEVKEKNYYNDNGQYHNTNFNLAAAYKLSQNQQLSWITQFYNGTQHYPIFSKTQTKTKYLTNNIYNLLGWDWQHTRFTNSLKAGMIKENFNYFEDIARPKSSGGTSSNFILKEDFKIKLHSKWRFNLLTQYKNTQGKGFQSGIDEVSRNELSLAGLLRYSPVEFLQFEAGIKKDFVEKISSPLLFSFHGNWQATRFYQIEIDLSRNFRYPSFNDLYWQPGGNLDLKSETSYQAELRNEFKMKYWKISFTPYLIDISDMLRWLPTSNGYWAPVNTDQVISYGAETQVEFSKSFGNHKLRAQVGHAFTKSENKENGKQLMYVPLHKFNGNIEYHNDFLKIYVQGIYNGLTYTDSQENLRDALQPYFLINAGAEGKIFQNLSLGFKVNNIFNEIYATTAYYVMPLRNYSINIHINF